MSEYHTPVLFHEALDALHVIKGEQYIDATLGGGGHAFEIVKRGGLVLGIDTDEEAIEHVKEIVQSSQFTVHSSDKLVLALGNFKDIDQIAHLHGFDRVSGILFDLGVSSKQLDTPERGFSFQTNGPLDMRMGKDLQVTAADLVNGLSKKELVTIFRRFGEEPRAVRVADAIVSARAVAPITTTDGLSQVVMYAMGYSKSAGLPKVRAMANKRIFQALRIAVNSEQGVLSEALPKAVQILATKGRLVVITFHSLEDAMVKAAFNSFEQETLGIVLAKKPIEPTQEEQAKNRRSRSAKLRVFEKH